ncbi:MAG TPA: YrhK family protein, partial [Desulfuromonadales bacterium]|nr:YrhK family protein [Desulfuromonadales bacterium]
HRYLGQPWFLELLLILKNGYYGNGNFNYIDTLESSFRETFISGILELIRSGLFVKLLVRLKAFLNDDTVRDRIREFIGRTETAARLHTLYDWLGIGNDLAIGLEFLIGSICFLPGRDEYLGVWLFIVGSSQLLIRPLIVIARKAHLGRLYRRKIKF